MIYSSFFLIVFSCGREWCWICRETIIQTDLHFTFSQCAGLQFSDVSELTAIARVAQYARLATMPVVVVGGAALALALAPIGAAVFGVYHLRRQHARRRRHRQRIHARRRRGIPRDGDDGPEYKIGVYGDGGVGKSSIVIQLTFSRFFEENDPTIEDSYRKQLSVNGVACVLDILDTAGQEEFHSNSDNYFRFNPYSAIVYSIDSRYSFEQVDSFVQQILRVRDTDTLPPTILVGNKADLEAKRQVTRAEGQQKAAQHGAMFIETSAKDRINIDELFFQIVQAARINRHRYVPS